MHTARHSLSSDRILVHLYSMEARRACFLFLKKRRKSFITLLTYVSDITVLLAVFLQAVDVVGQAGKPKTITGFQTHTTPVLLAYGERAELATEECILCSFCHKPGGPSGRSLSMFL